MPRAYSVDLRERIVDAYRMKHGTISELAELFGVSSRSISRYIKKDGDGCDLLPNYSTGRPPKLDDKSLGVLKLIVEETNDGRLQDYCMAMKLKTGIEVGKSTIWNALKKIGLNLKKRPSMLQSENQ